ncbi:MAG: DUF1073 domain-containing protein [Cetobacterium sp.]|uniref:anti-CBASS protein Acb1 family protein n=2 Tax=Cetobacterium sp. TaxID=2071632 RepID=UPI002FCC07AE
MIKRENSFTKRVDNAISDSGAFDRDVQIDYRNLKAEVLDQATINNLYAGNSLFKRIIDEIPGDSLKKGFEIEFSPENETLQGELEDMFDSYELDNYLIEFLQKGRKDGFCALLPIVVGNSLVTSQPLDFSNVSQILDFNIIPKERVVKIERNIDITKPFYGEIEYFHIQNGDGTIIKYHSSWALIYETGIKINEEVIDNSFNLSIYAGLFDALQVNYNIGWSAGQYAFASFAKVLKLGNQQEIERMKKEKTIDAYKKKKELEINTSSFVVLGKDDTLESVNLSGNVDFEKLQKVSLNDIATRMGIPVSKLMGASAGALASSAEDTNRYIEIVEQYQNVIVKDYIREIIKMFLKVNKKNDKNFKIKFKSIKVKSEREENENDKLEAEKNKIEAETLKIKTEILININKELNDDNITKVIKSLAEKLKNELTEDLLLND